jgi:integrase/recombinase XerD
LTKEKIIESNPCDNLKAIKTPKVMKDYFTEEEMDLIRKNCSNKRQKAIVEVLYSSGLRVSELISLNKNDINWARGMANIIGKGNKERTVYFSDEALRLLKDYLDTRDDKNEALFVTMVKPVKRLSIESIESSMRELGRRIDIRVYPHKFRHTCATILLEKGMSIQDVSEVLGHSRLETTMIYITLNKNKILEKYKECMNGARAK